MAGELIRPGVEVIQQLRSASPSFTRPTLVPCVVGPAFEVLNVLSTDGSVNSKALFGAYAQLGKSIAFSSFPDPRGNIDELTLQEGTTKPYMLYSGSLKELPVANGSGSAFLATVHRSSKAAIRTKLLTGTVALDEKVLVLAIDQPVRLDTSNDITVVFSGTIGAADIAEQINSAVGITVATVVASGNNAYVQIASPSYGAMSSVTVRAGGSANTLLELGYTDIVPGTVKATNGSDELLGTDTLFASYLTIDTAITVGGEAYSVDHTTAVTDTVITISAPFAQASANALVVRLAGGAVASREERVEGSGFRGQDQSLSNTTVTPWVEFTRGGYFVDGFDTVFDAKVGLIGIENQTFTSAKATNVTFGESAGQFPVKVGDTFYADGVKLKDGEVMKVESERFKVGTINPVLSTADSNGNYITKVYDEQKVGTLFDTTPFAPIYAYFKAFNLDATKVAPTADSVTGSVEGNVATAAYVESDTVSVPATLAGLKLHYIVEIDGVLTEDNFTFTGGPFASVAAIVTNIGTSIPGVGVSDSSGKLKFTTTATGRLQSFVIKADGTANTALNFSPSADTSSTATYLTMGKDVEFLDIAAVLTSGAHTFPFTSTQALTLVVEVTTDGGVTWPVTRTFTFPTPADGAYANIAALLAGINTGTRWDTTPDLPSEFTITSSGTGTLVITSTAKGSLSGLRVKASSTAIGDTTNADLLLTSLQTDYGEDNLNGLTFQFSFDSNPHLYEVTFSSDSLDLAVDEINKAAGFTAASKAGGTERKLKIISPLAGPSSVVTIVSSKAADAFGIATNGSSAGIGRPYPDAYIDDVPVLHIGAQILRDQVTGYPIDQLYGVGNLYVQYKALRKDVSAMAQNAGVIRLSDVATLAEVLDPLTEDNPLGLGAFLCMINCPTFEVKLLGIDEVTPAASTGTGIAWARALAMLEAEEVYTIAPLTHDEVVHGMVATHIELISQPEHGGERIAFISKVMPTRKNSDIALSGTQSNSTATVNQMLLDADPAAGLVALGINPALPIPETSMVYMEFEVDGELRRYNVISASGPLVSFRLSFSETDTNVDGFFSTVKMDSSVVNAAYKLAVRGASVAIPGTNPEKLDYSLVANTVAGANESFANRRLFSVFPDNIKTVINGIEKSLPSYYASACMAGMVGAQPPQQGFTNFPITGLTGVVGTENFTKRQLNTMAGGGTYILIQDVQGGAVSCRHQVSTDLTSIETRELSITKVVDFTAKILRAAVRKFIGTNNVDTQLLDALGTTIQAVLKFLEDTGVLLGSNLNNIAQDSAAPDTVLVDVTVQVPYPCNYIRITVVV